MDAGFGSLSIGGPIWRHSAISRPDLIYTANHSQFDLLELILSPATAAVESRHTLRALSMGGALVLHGGALAAALLWIQSAPIIERPTALSVSLLTEATPEKAPEPLPPAPPPPEPTVKPKPRPLITAAKAEPQPDAIVVPPPPVDLPGDTEPVVAYSPAETAAQSEPARPEPPRFDMAYLQNPAPVYPPTSKKLREEGTVELRVVVSETGEALSVEIARSSGYSRLDDAARRAVARWRFVPSKRGSTPVQGIALVPLAFSLKRAATDHPRQTER